MIAWPVFCVAFGINLWSHALPGLRVMQRFGNMDEFILLQAAIDTQIHLFNIAHLKRWSWYYFMYFYALPFYKCRSEQDKLQRCQKLTILHVWSSLILTHSPRVQDTDHVLTKGQLRRRQCKDEDCDKPRDNVNCSSPSLPWLEKYWVNNSHWIQCSKLLEVWKHKFHLIFSLKHLHIFS